MAKENVKMTFVGSTPFSTDYDVLSYVSSRNMTPVVHRPYWNFNDNSELELKLQVDDDDDVMLTISGRCGGSAPEDKCVNRMSVTVNDTLIIESEFQSPVINDFIVSIPSKFLRKSNILKIYYANLFASTANYVELSEVRVECFPFNYDNVQWMSGIRNSYKLCDINIPGSHDAASIRKSCVRSVYPAKTVL